MNKTPKTNCRLKMFTVALVFAFLFTSFPVITLAQTATSQTTSANQAAAFSGGVTSPSGRGGAGSVVSSSGTCLASSILSSGISSSITSAIGSLSSIESIANIIDKVSVNESTLQDKQELIKQASTGATIPFTNVLIGASWDGVAWCIANSLIEYVANSTIAWANSGFNGSPAFITNTDNFFEFLADREAGNFINSIARDVSSGGVNLCSNFKVGISIGLSNYYSRSSSYSNTASCSLAGIVNNIDNFVDGNFSEGGWAGWFAMTQNQQNNRIGATILATKELYARVGATNSRAQFELGLNNGFLNYTKCTDPKDKRTCKTVTPGTVIQSSLEKSLNLSKDRLVAVQKFDQVIESVVNNLIKVALNEVLSSN